MPATFRLVSPSPPNATGQAALAIVQLDGDIDAALVALGIAPVAPGDVRLRSIVGVDTLVVARFTPGTALLFPHAGPAVVRRLHAALVAANCTPATEEPPCKRFPDGQTELDARLSDALARAASPLAIDVLLAQPLRHLWAARDQSRLLSASESALLGRLIDPPLVVALGPPNIGKSSLLNALAGRGVSIVADEPGTTRDHVGVQLDLGGLVVRYVDTPGVHPVPGTAEGQVLAEAQAAAAMVAAGADLILLCSDLTAGEVAGPPGVEVVRVGLRSDLGPGPGPVDVRVSAYTGAGLVELVGLIRERLVPSRLLADPRAWVF